MIINMDAGKRFVLLSFILAFHIFISEWELLALERLKRYYRKEEPDKIRSYFREQ